MKKKALHKDFFMEIKKSFNRFISIFFIVAMGVAFYSGIQSAAPDMRLSGDAYFDENNLMDLKIIGTLGLTDKDIQAILAVDGVSKAESGYMTDVLCGSGKDEKVLHMESMLPTLNKLSVSEGRLPETTGECIVDEEFLSANGYKVGDTIQLEENKDSDKVLKNKEFKIVGTGNSPAYISFSKGNTTLGTGEVSGYGYVMPEEFDQAAYTFAYVEAEGSRDLTSYTEEYDRLVDNVTKNVEGIESVQCTRRFAEVKDEADIKLADARKELEDGKQEADEKLADAKKELKDGEKELEDGKQKLADAKKEVQDNKATLTDKQKELDSAKKQLDSAKTQLKDGKDTLASKESEFQAKYPEASKQIKDGEAAIAAGKTQISKAQSDYETGKKKLEAASKQYEAGKKQLDQGKKQYESGKARLDQANKQYKDGVSQLDAAKKQYETGTGQLAAAKTEYEKNAAVLQQAKVNFQAEKEKFDISKAEYDKNAAALDAAKSQIAGKQAELASAAAEYEAKMAELNQAKNALAQLQAAIDAGTATAEQIAMAGQLKEQIAQSEPVLAQKKAELDKGNEQLRIEQQKAAAMEAALAPAKQQIEAGQQKINAAQAELTKSEAGLQAGKAEIDKNEAALKAASVQINENEKKLAAAKKEIDSNQKKLASAKKEIDEKEPLLVSAKTELDKQTKVLNDGKKTLDSQSALLIQKEKELQEGKNQLSQGEAQLAAAKKELASKESELNSAVQKTADGQKQIEDGLLKLSDAEKEITDGEKEITENEQKLKDGKKEYKKAKKDAKTEISDGETKIADAEKEIDDLKEPEWHVNDRSSLPENTGYGENADRIKNIGEVFPVLFFLVAALISLTTMTRMVEEERTQIGTLKALGYGKFSIASKYLNYALFATIGGSILGVLVGEKILPYIIITAYGIMYHHMPNVELPYNLKFAGIATFAAVCCTMIATFAACYKELAETPAKLMRPPAPKEGKRVLLERVTFIWKHLSFTWKSTIRNLFRYKKRFFMTIFGIGGCMALLLVGYGIRDSVRNIAVLQYQEIQLYDGTVLVDEDASDEKRADLESYMKTDSQIDASVDSMMQKMSVKVGKKDLSVYIIVPKEMHGFDTFVNFRDRKTKRQVSFGDDGVIVTEKTANMMGLSKGDIIELHNEDGTTIKAPIADICENYLAHYVYMSPSLYEKVTGKNPDYNSILFKAVPDAKDHVEDVGQNILGNKAALSVSYTSSVMKQLDDMLSSLDVVIVVLIVSAGMLAFVVLYNLNNININERKRELATIKVLGFYDNEVCAYVYRENILLTFFGVLLGIVLGIVLHRFVIVTVEVDACMFGRNINFPSFIYSILFTCGFSLIVNVVMYFKLKKIDMVESLKSVE